MAAPDQERVQRFLWIPRPTRSAAQIPRETDSSFTENDIAAQSPRSRLASPRDFMSSLFLELDLLVRRAVLILSLK